MIIGLTGKNCAGKGEAAAFLQTIGYLYHSLSDVLREAMRSAGADISRKSLVEFANQLRTQKGPGYLAERVMERLDPEKHYVIDSIRNPFEVEVLRRHKHFHLMAIVADAKTRFERMCQRGRESDPTTYDAFRRLEAAEAGSADPAMQQLNRVTEMSDAEVANNAGIEDFHQRLREILRLLAAETHRPDWNTYFMNIAKVVALRSNCLKRKVAAVLVKDGRIISTGYNGTPRGIQNCNEGGCPRCNSLGESGAALETCLCSHAEENAIVQSAYHGVSIKGATIYCTLSPCLLCTKMIINAGIAEVVYQSGYPLEGVAQALLKEAGVTVTAFTVKETP
ncbi:MAG: AAA family ATPase [Deltaproteobacteria bacterium]|nr:AAA family ATPase [Deltaproteobacteria bacterium]